MLFWVVLGVNFLYLISELIFNAKLVDIASVNSTAGQIHHLEIFGRILSTIGISLLLLKFVNMTKLEKSTKIFIGVAIILCAHPLFYIGQKALVDHFSNKTSTQQQKSYYNTLLVKKAIIGSKKNDSNFNFYDNPNSIYSKIFLTTIGSLKNNSSIINHYENNKNLIKYAAINDSHHFSNQLYDNYIELTQKNSNLYNLYRNVQDIYNTKLKTINQEVTSNYNRYTNVRFRKLMFQYYKNIIAGIHSGHQYFKNQMPKDVMNTAWEISSCNNTQCAKQKINSFQSEQQALAQKYTKNKANEMPAYSFYKFCHINNFGNKRNTSFAIHYIENGQEHTRTGRDYNGNMICHFNLDKMGNTYLYYFNKIVKENVHIHNYHYKNYEEFSNSIDYRNFLVAQAKKQNVNLKLPYNWNYKDKATFIKMAKKPFKEKLDHTFESKIKDKFNISLPLNLTRKEFLNSTYIVNYVNQEYNKKFDLKINQNENKQEFFLNNKNKLLKTEIKNLQHFDFKNKGDNIVKAMVVPPFALVLSLIFLLLNFIFLIKNIFSRYTNTKIATITTLSLFFVIFIMPLFFTASDAGNALIVKDLINHNLFCGLFYDWITKIETVIHPLGQALLNNSGNIIQYFTL